MSRIATVVLVSSSGELLGALPPVELEGPYWPESADVVAALDAQFGVRVVMLRLLHSELPRQPGGNVTYLAEQLSGTVNVALQPVSAALRERALRDVPKRLPWATLGGPARSLAWARAALAALGRGSFQAVQQRTWNLSTLWRLEPESATTSSGDGTVWLKQVPPFMSYESRVLGWLNRTVPGSAPRLLAADDAGRSLLAHVVGDDLYGAPVALRRLINQQLHAIQCAGADAIDELLALGIPDLRGPKRVADMRQKLMAWCPGHPGLDELLQQLERQLERLEECALPATLVHADNHPGNARGSAQGVSLLDWGEAFIGSPVTDLLGALGGLSLEEAAPLRQEWCQSWKQLAPRSKPEQALELAPLISALHGAATYASFLHQIEETEWPYHLDDVPRCLEQAAQLARLPSC